VAILRRQDGGKNKLIYCFERFRCQDEEKTISNCLRSLAKQNLADFEIIIIDEYDSNEKTKKIIYFCRF
jgi:hypothetical protein